MKKLINYLKPGWQWLNNNKLKAYQKVKRIISIRVVLEVLLVILLLFVLVNLKRLGNKIEQMSELYEIGLAQKESAKKEPGPTVQLLSPQPGAMVLLNTIDIEGKAEKEQIISIVVNNTIRQVTLARNGKFRFENVELSPGQNHLVIRSISPAGVMAIVEEIDVSYGTPMLEYLAQDFNRGRLTDKKIALTFDGGAEDNATTEILDYLAEKNINVTMFLTGDFIRHYPNQVLRMVKAGHEIGNHTKSHPHLTTFASNYRHNTLPYVTPEFLKNELLETERLFNRVCGVEMAKLWRAPFGEHNDEIRKMAAVLGYRQIGWSADSHFNSSMDALDWVADKNSDIYRSADEIMQKILNFGNGDPHGANGAIILMHLGTLRADDQAHKMLPTMIDSLQARGYELVKVSEIF